MSTQRYILPIAVILAMLQEMQETASLRASLPASHLTQFSTPTLAEVFVERGSVTTCTLRAVSTGQVLAQQRDAMALLTQAGELEWQVLPQHFSMQPAVSLSSVPVSVPLHISPPARKTALESLSVRSRHVLMLMNGGRTLQDIARLLNMSPDEAEHLAQTLHQQRLISWSS